jgi:hypothetical protein
MDQITDNLCSGCFTGKGRTNPCPHCCYDETAQRINFLLPHHSLLNGQFLVGRVLGKPGGFGVTYLGWDQWLHRRVAIKEYFPRARRDQAQLLSPSGGKNLIEPGPFSVIWNSLYLSARVFA